MRLLLLDTENSPNLVHCWELYNQNISINQIIKPKHVLCWAAKWVGENEMYFDSVHKSTPKQMIRGIHHLLEQADAVIHFNGKQHDIPLLNMEFVLHGLKPPAPLEQIDLLTVVRKQFAFPSNKLAYVVKALKLGEKMDAGGHELWVKCMEGDEEAWKTMEQYNCMDVYLLEKLYEVLKPWIKHHPSRGLYTDANKVCPVCGSNKLQHRGFRVTKVHKFQRYQCKCGAWSSSRVAEEKEAKVIA